MARAKRHYIPGQVWHITHRCHKKEFLLKFSKDRNRWLQWLYQARKLGDAGRRKVREEYAADHLLDRLLGIYEKVIMDRKK